VFRLVCVLALLIAARGNIGAQSPERPTTHPLHLPTVQGLDEYVPTPADNQLTVERVALGRRLFFDSLLSSNRRMACSSCHAPRHAFSDSVAIRTGATGRAGRRNAPAILNRAWGVAFFWDGRAKSLEEQVLQPIQDSLEMALPMARLLERLEADDDYGRSFSLAFPDGVTANNVARALASYVRTIRSGDSPLDRYQAGDTTALSAEAKRGLELFRGKANCAECHLGPNLTDEEFHNTGVSAGTADAGRHGVTAREADRGKFKTPTLREVARTGPYMHDGSIATLDDVVTFYDGGGKPNPELDREIHKLGLSASEKRDLVAFLRSLTGTVSEGIPE
jgi:cytochrome c peroxidase